MRNMKIASAVAASIAAASLAPSAFAFTGESAQQTAAAAVPSTNLFYMGGSSAAATSIAKGIATTLCQGGVIYTFQTVPATQPAAFSSTSATPFTNIGTPDFRAYYCVAAQPSSLAGQGIVIEYRADGGSIVGAFGALNHATFNQLDLTKAWCTADSSANTFDCATSNNTPTAAQPSGTSLVVGTTKVNGTHDSYTGALFSHALEYGVSDEEPGIYGNGTGAHYAGNGAEDGNNPTNVLPYPYNFLGGDANAATLNGMTHTLFIQQIFGFVASTNLGITDISSADVANILNGTVTDWGNIHNVSTGAAIAPKGTKINVCQRDKGSGTRTGADVIFTQNGCNPNAGNSSSHLVDASPTNDNFSTPDELLCVNNTNNSFGYVSVDNFSKVVPGGSTYPNVHSLTLDNTAPSQLLAATGNYKYVVESSVQEAVGITLSSQAGAFWGFVIPALSTLSTAGQSANINSLPLVNSTASGGATLNKNNTVFVSEYMRDPNGIGNTCNGLQFVAPTG